MQPFVSRILAISGGHRFAPGDCGNIGKCLARYEWIVGHSDVDPKRVGVHLDRAIYNETSNAIQTSRS